MTHILEHEERLSQSLLWQLQTNAYCLFGPQAWSHKGVPFYITSNPFIVNQYAQLALAYIQDSASELHRDEPIYIFDLGAGSGRFAYLFLKKFLALLDEAHISVKIRYIMTDIAEKNLLFWKQHSYLQQFIQKGILDFTLYHHEDQADNFELYLSKEKIKHTENPPILIANYFFDTIPQDLFRVHQQKLEEGRITISSEHKTTKKESTHHPEILDGLTFEYSYKPIKTASYYAHNETLNRILHSYEDKIETPFLFPTGAFHVLNRFSKLSKGQLFLLAGDQGVHTIDQIIEAGEPKISKHATFSIPVNYHAVAQYFKMNHGTSFVPESSDPQFIVFAGALEKSIDELPTTKKAFEATFNSFEPCDYFHLINAVIKDNVEPSLEHLFLLLKLGRLDPGVFNEFYNIIHKNLLAAPPAMQKKFVIVIDHIWENFYPVTSDEGQFINNLGVLLFDMHEYSKALIYFQRALELQTNHPQTLQNIMACLAKTKS